MLLTGIEDRRQYAGCKQVLTDVGDAWTPSEKKSVGSGDGMRLREPEYALEAEIAPDPRHLEAAERCTPVL